MISRAPQTWPSDVTHELPPFTDKEAHELIALVAAMQDAGEDEIERERRTR